MRHTADNSILNQYFEHTSLSEKQRSVLKASLVLFAEHGYENTSTRSIAKLANVSEGTVYKQFKTKREILDTLLAPLENEIIPQVASQFIGELAARPETSLEDLLNYGVANRLTFAMRNRAILRVLFQEVSKDATILRQLTDRVRIILDHRVDGLLAYYQARGELVNRPEMEIFQCVAGTTLTHLLPNLLMGTEDLDIKATTSVIVSTIMHGIAPQSEA